MAVVSIGRRTTNDSVDFDTTYFHYFLCKCCAVLILCRIVFKSKCTGNIDVLTRSDTP